MYDRDVRGDGGLVVVDLSGGGVEGRCGGVEVVDLGSGSVGGGWFG